MQRLSDPAYFPAHIWVVALLLVAGCSREGEPVGLPPEALSVPFESTVVVDATAQVAAPLPPLAASAAVQFHPDGATQISQVRWVSFRVVVTGAQGTEAALELDAPQGSAYLKQTVTTVDSPFDAQTFAFELPVAGTLIDQVGLSGLWTGRFMIADQVLTAPTFQLDP